MLTNISLSQGFEKIGRPTLVMDEIIIPAESRSNSNSPYRPEYEWLFVYERKIAKFLSPWLEHLRFELIGEKGVLCEALSNAFCHGHHKNPAQPITVCIYLGQKGLIVRIMDNGEGFNIKSIIDNYSKGKNYYHMSGNGIRQMIRTPSFEIFYTDQGKSFNLLYLLSPCKTS